MVAVFELPASPTGPGETASGEGKQALKLRLGTGSGTGKSLIFVWSVWYLSRHSSLHKPGLAKQKTHNDPHKQSGMDTQRENVFSHDV